MEPAALTAATAATAAMPAIDTGLGHFLAQTDAVGLGLFALLMAMSVLSWTLIAAKGIAQARRRRHATRFLAAFWNAPSLQAVRDALARPAGQPRDPFARLAAQGLQAQAHHARHGATRLQEAGTAHEFLTRSLKKALDEETLHLESGLTPLATIGATAPFVGLFGTVWGVYHALIAIGLSGAGTLDRVATPVGEALIMTGIGLAVAIPAVVAYNAFVRANRVTTARLDAFAHDLFTFLSTGEPIPADATPKDPGAPRPARPPRPVPTASRAETTHGLPPAAHPEPA